MATTKTHIGKQEEDIAESAVQIRTDDPVSPADKQLWLNTTQNRVKLRDGNDTKIILEGHIGAALLLQSDGIMNAALSRSYYKDVTAPFALNSIANLVEGLTMRLRVNNPSAKVKAIYTVQTNNSEDVPDGSMFNINAALDAFKYYVWMDKDGLGLATPVVSGRTGLRVVYTAGRKNKSTFTQVAGANITSGQYFVINNANNATSFYVWFNKDAGGGNPNVPGKTGISVAINGTDTANQVAGKVAVALTNANFTSSSTGAVVTSENNAIGSTTASANGTVPGLVVATTIVGANAQTATEIAVNVAAVINATGKFTVPVPSTPTMTITAFDFGYATPPGDINTGFIVLVATPGSGGINVVMPNTFFLDTPNPTAFVDGGQSVMFEFFRSGSLVFVVTSKFTLP